MQLTGWVTIHTDTDTPLDPQQIYFITGFPGAPPPGVLSESRLTNVPAGSYEVFEPLVADATQSIQIYAAHSEIHFYTWGGCECCLAAGATSVTLTDAWVPAPTPPPTTTPPATAPGGPAPTAPSTRPDTPAAPIPAQPATSAGTQPEPTARASGSGAPPGMVPALNLQVGDVLIFEEVIGPKTGNPPDADPLHRQAVRLTKVTPAVDPLNPYNQPNGQPVLEIEWCSEDALTFPLCISAQAPPHPPVDGPAPCSCMENVSVARGNVILVDNGSSAGEFVGTVPTQSITERCPTPCDPPDVVTLPGKFRPTLQEQPLTFGQPLPPCRCASALIVQYPRQALPEISLTSIPPAPQCATGAMPDSAAFYLWRSRRSHRAGQSS